MKDQIYPSLCSKCRSIVIGETSFDPDQNIWVVDYKIGSFVWNRPRGQPSRRVCGLCFFRLVERFLKARAVGVEL